MISKNKVVYFGIAFLPDKNALALRASSMAKLARELGYEPIIVGMDPSICAGTYQKSTLDGIDCYEIQYPTKTIEWIKSLVSTKALLKVFEDIGVDHIHSIIMADYRFFVMFQIWDFCKQNDIRFIADIMDWFVVNSYLNPKEWVRGIDSWLRVNILYPFLNRRICICHNFERKYRKRGKNVIIPMVQSESVDKIQYTPTDKITFAFAGQPGKGCCKEKIDWLIRAIYELKLCKKVVFEIAGITKEQFIIENPNMERFINDESIVFLGRISHSKCVEMISKADYSVLLRKKTRLSEYGFSTKISEAFLCGTPLLATDTSDTSIYVESGVNGFVCGCSYESVKDVLRQIIEISPEKYLQIRKNVSNENALSLNRYIDMFKEIL